LIWEKYRAWFNYWFVETQTRACE